MESVHEAASIFSSINLMRREIELSVFSATEQSSIRNQQAHMKKFQFRKYHHNEKVLFHKPHTNRMVIIPNQVGEIINVLPGGYYEIKSDVSGTEHRIQLHSSSIVPYSYPEAQNIISGTPKKSHISAETLQDEVLRYAVTQRQNYFKKSTRTALHKYDLLDVYEDELKLKYVLQRMELKNRDDPDTLINLYCYACDCFIVSCLVASIKQLHQSAAIGECTCMMRKYSNEYAMHNGALPLTVPLYC